MSSSHAPASLAVRPPSAALPTLLRHLVATLLLAATPLARSEVALVWHSRSGEVERPSEDRPRAGEPDEPGYHRFQSFHYRWPELTGLPDAKVAARLNQQLRALVPATLPSDSEIIHGFDTPVDESVVASHAQLTPQTLIIVLEHGHRGADAPKHSLSTSIIAFDLATGRELTFADFFSREHWPAVDREFRRAFDAFNDEYVLYTDDEFPRIDASTRGYFDGGHFRLLVRPGRSSSFVDDNPFLDIPLGPLVGGLTPRARAILATPINAGWCLEETNDEFFATSPKHPALRLPLHCDGWVLWLHRWEIPLENRGLGLLHYFAGIAGTSSKYALTRAAVVRLADGEVLGHPLTRIDPIGDAASVPQPVWHWQNGHLTVRTEGEPDETY